MATTTHHKKILRQQQMKYLMENMREPNFALIDSTTTNVDKNDDVLNTAGITYRILNSQGFGMGAHHSSTLPSWGSVAYFMASIQNYLPKSLRTTQKLWSISSFHQNILRCNPRGILRPTGEYTQELLNDMCDWLFTMKTRIEDYVASRYFIDGRTNHLETLKRRFKDDWSERTEQHVDATLQDTELKVIIEDA